MHPCTKEGRGTVRALAEKGHEVNEGTAAFFLLRKAKKIVSLQIGEDKVAWRPHSKHSGILDETTGKSERDSLLGTVVIGQGVGTD